MDRITAAEVFVTIVDRGSMIAAAETLEMSRAMVTRYRRRWSNGPGRVYCTALPVSLV
ncbi:LysR family transcriptional regulator [Serratia ureilytica]